jgi:hypothetical protein
MESVQFEVLRAADTLNVVQNWRWQAHIEQYTTVKYYYYELSIGMTELWENKRDTRKAHTVGTIANSRYVKWD